MTFNVVGRLNNINTNVNINANINSSCFRFSVNIDFCQDVMAPSAKPHPTSGVALEVVACGAVVVLVAALRVAIEKVE